MILKNCKLSRRREDCEKYEDMEAYFYQFGLEFGTDPAACEYSSRADGLCPYLMECEECGAQLVMTPESTNAAGVLDCPNCQGRG